MCSSQLLSLACVLLLSTAVFSAPLTKEQHEVKKRDASQGVKEVQDQEKDLQDLLSLVNNQKHQDGVMVHKAQVSHLENNNGNEVKVEEKEEKVIDTKSGNVIADVKQEVKQEGNEGMENPETVVKTKVDIPAAGVHETFVEDEQENNAAVEDGEEPAEETNINALEPELTPTDMAEYLYATQQFDAFYAALDRLVNQSKMRAEDAEIYAKTVALEYERLQLAEFENSFMSEKRFYPQGVPEVYGQDPSSDLYPQVYPGEERLPHMDYFGYPAAMMSPEDQFLAQQPEMGSYEDDIDPYEFLATLWNEAYGKGNREAQEIVKMLYDRVSQDGDPDDMGQIKDILVQTVEASLNENPFNYQPQIMPNMDNFNLANQGFPDADMPNMNTLDQEVNDMNAVNQEVEQSEQVVGNAEEGAANAEVESVEDKQPEKAENNENKTEVKAAKEEVKTENKAEEEKH